MNDRTLKNPILPGFYPDPSICRVGDDFFMVTSSFSLFPGIPIFHSTDLIHWEQIGHVLDRRSQLHVTSDHLTGGIMAPTIRFHNGTFYVIGTNFSDKGNFIVTAKDPAGPWSEPHWLPDAPGIDPSLFFDDDGKAYFTGTRRDRKPDGTPGEQVIWVSEIDLEKMRLVGESKTIWAGALKNCASPEAPHLYKKDGYYYLVIAEGGTEHFHAVTVARSRSVFGEYEGYAGNPIMTHRHLGRLYPICNVGHADLVELKNGDWYAVMLGSRLVGGYHKNLGRETFIAPVAWEEGWPVISPGTGRVEWSYPAPELAPFATKPVPVRDDFDGDRLGMDWVFFGTPYEDFYALKDSKLMLKLLPRPMAPKLEKIDFSKVGREHVVPNVSFVGRRQRHLKFRATAHMHFAARSENETAGLVVMQAANHQFRLERTMKNGIQTLRLIQCTSRVEGYPHWPNFKAETTEQVLAETEAWPGDIVLRIEAEEQSFHFHFGTDGQNLRTLYENADGRAINPESIGCMVGTLIGMYASSNGKESDNAAAFDWFDYEGC